MKHVQNYQQRHQNDVISISFPPENIIKDYKHLAINWEHDDRYRCFGFCRLKMALKVFFIKKIMCMLGILNEEKYCAGENLLHLHPFAPNAPFLYLLKTLENRKVFLCFQGVEKGCIGNKSVED